MVFGTMIINALRLTRQQIDDNYVVVLMINSISLFLIIVVLAILHIYRRELIVQRMDKIHPIFFVCGLVLSI